MATRLRSSPVSLVRSPSLSRAQRGFTLIEVLLATAVLAAGLALAFATLRAATVSAQRAEDIAQRSERMRAVEGFLRRRLSSALPITFAKDSETGRSLRFVGEPDRIRFVADLPNYLGRGGPSLHDIGVQAVDGQSRLVVSFSTVLAGMVIAEAAPRPPEPLVRDLLELRIRYRGLDPQNAIGEWSDRWEAVDTLPLQVSIEIISASGGRWPPMLVNLPQRGPATVL